MFQGRTDDGLRTYAREQWCGTTAVGCGALTEDVYVTPEQLRDAAGLRERFARYLGLRPRFAP